MKKRKTITSQLMTRIIVSVLALMLIVVGRTLVYVDETVRSVSATRMSNEAQVNSTVLSEMFVEVLSALEPVKDVLENVAFEDDTARLSYMETTINLNENIPAGVYMGDNKGNYLDSSRWVPDADYVTTDRDWYKEGMTHDDFTLGVPYLDAESGRMIVSITAKSKIPGWGSTVIAGDMFLDNMSDYVSELAIMDEGYSFVLDPVDNMIIAHKNIEYNGMLMTDAAKTDGIVSYLQTMNDLTVENVQYAKADGENYMLVITPIENTQWYLVCCVQQSVVLSQLKELVIQIFVIAVVMTAIILLYMARAISTRTKPIGRLTTVIEGITSGDFTLEIVPTGNDEITTMSEKLREFIGSMRNTIQEISGVSVELASQADNSASVSGVLNSSANVQSESMGQMNMTVDDLAHSIESIAGNATLLAETVGVVMENSSEAEGNVAETVEAAEHGKEEIEKVARNMDQINEDIGTLSKIVGEVGESTEEINNITGLIGGIAQQTNLLALNESIEAARAGEAGRGFAVVADEIGKLASMSADSVKQIADLIEKINEQVKATIQYTGHSVDNIKESKVLVDSSYEAFMVIYEKVAMTDTNIKNVAAKIREVEDVANSMAAITEEQSASTEEILATSENLYEHSRNIAQNSSEVENMAGALKKTADLIHGHMNRFEV